MAKNHYVSQLIIRRFSDKIDRINIFDVKEKKILENKKSLNIFCKNNIYSDDIEDKLNRLLEDPFAKLIDSKIIGKDKVVVDRKDLFLIKKFLLLDSIRTLSAEGFAKIFSGFSENVERYWQVSEKIYGKMPNHLPKSLDLNESPQDAFERALKVFVESDSLLQIVMHEYVTRELYIWSKVFFDSYIAFWDSNVEQEFILTDNGLTSEYEPSHQLFGGLDHSKLAYLLHMLKMKAEKEETIVYSTLLDRITIMYENFSIFNLTSSRSIVIVNPFFKLFSKQGFIFNNNPKINPPIPDIWPSFIKNKLAFDVPMTQYKIKGTHSMEDEFIYNPHKLTLEDTIYVNHLFLSQTSNLLGFRSFEKIKDSLYAFQAIRTLNHKDIYTEDAVKNISNFVNHMMTDEFNYIWKYYREKEDIRPRENPFDFTERIAEMCFSDTRNNIYALEYLLNNESKVRVMSNFSFMGSPDERISLIKRDIKRIKGEIENE